jgi:hypothetical protein
MSFGLPFPITNGVRHSWSSVAGKFNGITIAGITSINYAPKLEPSVVAAAGPLPIGFTTGRASFTGDFEMLLQEANDFIASIGPSFMTALGNMEVSYSDEGYTTAGVGIYVDTISSFRITEMSAAMSSSSTDALVRKFTIIPLGILINGINPMPNQPSFSIGGVAGAAAGVVNRLF